MFGCFSAPKGIGTADALNALTSSSVGGCSPILSWVGGVCLLAGMALLVITRGTMGWRPLIGGIIFVLINYAIAIYANWFFLPVAICTGAISLAWAGKVVWKIINKKTTT